ncbi:hypothetical protein PV328_004152 [Microctonus aethiopoides]|uniref:UDP-glucuronosyltransferase n=1 Tax=Microctonus aethiopoides TaxID=144406 RepID=A0AA39F9W3_9HYME|nr:hypothetical protein PV328_004152 [Microctonus aethiopoides]
MKKQIILSVLLAIVSASSSESYRILGIFPFQSRSHQMLFDGIVKGLVRKGHQIDLVTVYPMKKSIPNYKVVVNLQNITESLVNKWNVKFASELGDDTLPIIALQYGNGLCEYLGLPELQKIIKNPPRNPPYDLVIVESFGANCFIGLGHVLKVPVVMASSTIDLPWLSEALGQPDNIAFFPAFFTSYSHPMTFLQRVHNTIVNHMNHHRFRRYIEDVQNAQMKKYLSPDIPPLWELEKNVVLALVNSFHSLNGIRPLTPGIIEVAGLHVHENYVELPQELAKWMNESTAGVVYFTLGSMVNIETFPDVTIRAFYSTFKKIAPVRVLMKVGNKENLLPGLPDNVMISSWIPQVAILAHKNTKVFITHGGLMSSQESLTFGVPIIGIPLFGDQFTNVEFFMKKNMALMLNVKSLTEESIHGALKKILKNPEYKKAAKYHSKRFLDRPLSAMDTAIYWIEYAIRNGPGALRSPAIDMAWWQVALLDVYAFLMLTFITISYLILVVLNFCLKILKLKSSYQRPKYD